MMVKPGGDDYTKTINHQKILWKTQKATTYWNPKEC